VSTLPNTTLIIILGLQFGSSTAIAQTTVPIPGFPPTLSEAGIIRYLNLTDSETAFVHQSVDAYNQVAGAKQQRVAQLRGEIANEDQQDPPDPMALGVRYAEIQTIRHDLANQQTALRTKLRASLDDLQRGKLDALSDARNLQPIVGDAQCANLIDQGISPSVCGYDTVLHQIVWVSSALLRYLSLSNDQAGAVSGLNNDNQQQTALNQEKISQLQGQILLENNKVTLDPLALGTLYSEIETTQRAIKSDQVTLRSNARAILSDLQRITLKSLDDARQLQLLIIGCDLRKLVGSSSWLVVRQVNIDSPTVWFLRG